MNIDKQAPAKDSNPSCNILVRKVDGEIVVLEGSQILDAKLLEFGEAQVRFPSGRLATVARTADGQLVEM